jgi:hypothetical protein
MQLHANSLMQTPVTGVEPLIKQWDEAALKVLQCKLRFAGVKQILNRLPDRGEAKR